MDVLMDAPMVASSKALCKLPACPAMMRSMTDERAWLRSYPSDVPHSLAPYPKESLFTLLRNAAAGFPDRPALAFFGAHMSYATLLSEVERFSAVLAGLGVAPRRPGRA